MFPNAPELMAFATASPTHSGSTTTTIGRFKSCVDRTDEYTFADCECSAQFMEAPEKYLSVLCGF